MPVRSIPEIACDVVLKDGSTVAFREARPADARAVRQFFEALSPLTQYQRFLGLLKIDDERIASQINPPGPLSCALVAECGGRIVAVAGFYAPPERRTTSAEVAFAIADAFQGRGIGTRLLERLADIGRARGLTRFNAYVSGENRRMLAVFEDSGFHITQELDAGLVHVSLALERSAAFAERSAVRAQVAATATMKPFFQPRSVAVIGASRRRGKIGSEVLANLLAAGFNGTLSVVHPAAQQIQGVTAYRSVTAIPGPVDLAIITVPAIDVPQVVDDCIAKGVRGICIISAGFAEAGPEGVLREAEILEKVRAAGCRLIGPNCMGLLNTEDRKSVV